MLRAIECDIQEMSIKLGHIVNQDKHLTVLLFRLREELIAGERTVRTLRAKRLPMVSRIQVRHYPPTTQAAPTCGAYICVVYLDRVFPIVGNVSSIVQESPVGEGFWPEHSRRVNRVAAFKTVSEVVAAIGSEYDGPTKKVKGSGGKEYDYISWDDSARQFDAVFGPLGLGLRGGRRSSLQLQASTMSRRASWSGRSTTRPASASQSSAVVSVSAS
jgi:hypothetical protein